MSDKERILSNIFAWVKILVDKTWSDLNGWNWNTLAIILKKINIVHLAASISNTLPKNSKQRWVTLETPFENHKLENVMEHVDLPI
jgi:hypothetical protein